VLAGGGWASAVLAADEWDGWWYAWVSLGAGSPGTQVAANRALIAAAGAP